MLTNQNIYLILFALLSFSLHGMQPLPPHERDRPNHNVRRDEPDSHQAEISAERRNQKVSKEKLPDDLHKLVFSTPNQGPEEIKRICDKMRFLVTVKDVDVDILNSAKRTPLFYAVMFAKPNLTVIKTLLWLRADPEKIKESDQIKQKLNEESHKEINELLSTQKKASDEELSRIKEHFTRRQKLHRKRERERAEQEVSCLAEAIILKEPSVVRKFLAQENPTQEILSLALIELGKKSNNDDLDKSWEILFDLISKNRALLFMRNEYGRTPLFDVVATRSQVLVVQLLALIERADELRDFVNIRDGKGLNALNYAAQFQAQDIVDFLKSQGCSEEMPGPREDDRIQFRRYRLRQVRAGDLAIIEHQPAEWAMDGQNENLYHRFDERQRRQRVEELARLNGMEPGQNQPRVRDNAQLPGGENRLAHPAQAAREVPPQNGLWPAQMRPQDNLQRNRINNARLNQELARADELWYRLNQVRPHPRPFWNFNADAPAFIAIPDAPPVDYEDIRPVRRNASIWPAVAVIGVGTVILLAVLYAYNAQRNKNSEKKKNEREAEYWSFLSPSSWR